jgi:hypothetical protein
VKLDKQKGSLFKFAVRQYRTRRGTYRDAQSLLIFKLVDTYIRAAVAAL